MHGLIHRQIHKNSHGHSDFWPKFLDKVTIIAGVIGPLMVLPQIYKIYSTHNATGVSAVSWIAFALLDIPFVIYGIFHRERPIIVTYSLWLIANLIVAVGAIIYR